jgi:hypothetical protein
VRGIGQEKEEKEEYMTRRRGKGWIYDRNKRKKRGI